MPGYNRVRSLAWPVVFHVEGGRRFTVGAPIPSPRGLSLRCRVETGPDAAEYEIGSYYGEQSAGAVIGRTIRWWIERTGIGTSIASPPVA